jgi:ABC-type glycerol-3-phosphate transport system substrate-binding protein
MQTDLERDLGFQIELADGVVVEQDGEGLHDGYVIQPPWMPTLLDRLESLSEYIAQSPAIKWPDIGRPVRDNVVFGGSVKALPLDIDNVQLGWREDVFERHGIQAPPSTLEELVILSERLNGQVRRRRSGSEGKQA